MERLVVSIIVGAVILTALIIIVASERGKSPLAKKQRKMLIRIIISAGILFGLQFVTPQSFAGIDEYLFPEAGRLIRFGLYLADYIIIGYDILKKAFRGIINRQVFDENFLMAVATIGAMALAVYSDGDYLEAIAVMLFYQVGEFFQGYAIGKSRKSIGELMDIRPDYANIEHDGKLERIDPNEVAVGSEIIIRSGEKVPIDGVVIEGSSRINTSTLTGESLPRRAKVGDELLSGCINMDGVLRVKTTKEFGESTVSKILDLVENASSRKSKSEAFISGFARIYTPVVCYGALALAILPPLVRIFGSGLEGQWGVWAYRALTFLVISCPCALVISIPLSFFAGIGGASREGILIKGSDYLERLSRMKIAVFDKTGTLTKGVFEVKEIHHCEINRDKLIEYGALAECDLSHPIAKSLRNAYGKEPDRSRVKDIREISGMGVVAVVDGEEVIAGNARLMEYMHIPYRQCHSAGTIIHMAINGRYSGHIVISDIIKPNSEKAISSLRELGVDQTFMLTGDSDLVAKNVASCLGINRVYSELMPEDKVAKAEELLRLKGSKDMLAFIGDGINDAPVLSVADIGIAMGAMGSDAAIEAADIVLMDDDPLKVSKAMGISKKCLRIVYQNITLALCIKFICLALGAFGEVNMYMAIFADVGVMVIAVLNAMRCLFVNKL